jgi:hypothetical protein
MINWKSSSPFPVPRSALLILFSLFFFLFSFVSCELFNAQYDPDYWQKLEDEIAWANAPKLTVAIAFPATWGTSNPQQGTITPARDIRKGYSTNFEIEFTPSQ